MTISPARASAAILKFSYNRIGDPTPIGGVVGTAWFINSRTAVTVNHNINDALFMPNPGFNHVQFWIVTRQGLVISLEKTFLTAYADKETTLIHFPEETGVLNFLKLADTPPQEGETVVCSGFVGGGLPHIESPAWQQNRLHFGLVSLENVHVEREGVIQKIGFSDINTNDVHLHNVLTLQLSFGGIEGMSGCAVRRKSTGEVVGLGSFGLPPDSPVKQTIFAIHVNELKAILNH